MASSVVGLDIGSFAVRAAELSPSGDTPTLNRFGQVTLPPGAVQDGEIVDIPAVSAAIRRLWSEAGFKGKRVVVGVANQRTIVRQADVPAMTEDDLRDALKFEAQELIPIPVDDAILDFRILDRFKDGEGAERMHIVLAAAQRDMVRSHLAAVEGAGLAVESVDTTPFALVRALADRTVGGDLVPNAEAVVCVGAAVTSVVVHEGGVPRFVRVLMVGGDDLTQAVAQELHVEVEQAEDLKRRAAWAGGAADGQVLEATRVMSSRIAPFVDEIRGSLDYYLAQADAAQIDRIVLTGGGSRVVGLVERLEHQLRTEVVTGTALDKVKIGDVGLDDAQLRAAEPIIAVPLGLALPPWQPLDGARKISLIPSDVAEKNKQRRQLVAAGIGVAAFGGLLALITVGRQAQIVAQDMKIADTEQESSLLQAQVAELAPIAKLEADLTQARQRTVSALQGEVHFTQLIQRIATTMPRETFLTNFTAQASGGSGTVSMTVTGAGHPSAAAWLRTVGTMPELSGMWVPSVAVDLTSGEASFTSAGTITPAAHSNRAAAYEGKGAR